MAKKQTRRSISVNRKRYDHAQNVAIKHGIALSQLCERGLDLAILEIQGKPAAKGAPADG